MSRLLSRLVVVLTAATALVAAGGSVAVAHVTVHSDDAVRGGAAEIAFRVPNESDTASTVTVSLALPADTPIAEVSVLPVDGWTYQATKAPAPASLSTEDGAEVSEVVSRIEWHATSPDTAVKPGQYQVFRIVAGPLPATDWLVFKVVQTYDDGQVQRWIDGPSADGLEPEHPAPMLAVDTTSAGNGHHQAATVAPAASSQVLTPTTTWLTVAIAMAALIAALGSVIVSVRTARTARRGGGDEPPG